MNSSLLPRLTLLAAASTLAGCGILSGDFRRDFSTRPIQEIGVDSVEKVLDTVKLRMYPPGPNNAVNAGLAGYDDCSRGSSSATACVAMRNATVATLVGVSDDACNEHLKSIYGNEASWNIALGSLAALFSGTAAVAEATAAKSNYAAAGAFFGAERSLTNEVVYKNQLVPAIHYKLVEKRKERRDALFQRVDLDVAKYPFRVAVADAIQYHYTCSFMEGLQWALREGTTDAKEVKLLKARADLRTAQVDLTDAQNAVRAVAPAATAASAIAADDRSKLALDRYKAALDKVKKLENGGESP